MPESAADYLPHKAPMMLLDHLVEVGDDTAWCRTHIGEPLLFLDSNCDLPAWVGIELIAQTVAVWLGHQARKEGRKPEIGFLLGTRKYSASVDVFPARSALDIKIRRDIQFGQMGQFSGEIFIGAEKMASSMVNVYLPTPEELAHLDGMDGLG